MSRKEKRREAQERREKLAEVYLKWMFDEVYKADGDVDKGLDAYSRRISREIQAAPQEKSLTISAAHLAEKWVAEGRNRPKRETVSSEKGGK